ncbi:hypothetical protein Tco_1493396 [Tanacetum coccineum]
MEQMTSICDMIVQYMQKKEEEKRIAEEQAAKNRYWKILICYDDDDDEESSIPLRDIIISGLPPRVAITPVLSTKEPVDSLIMEDEHLDTIPAMESDEVIKYSVENLVQIPSESEGIPEKMCDVPFRDNSPPLDISKDQFESFSDSNDDSTSIDDDSFSIDDIDYWQYHYSFYYSFPGYEAFYFDDDHIEEKSSGSTTTHSDISLSKYDSFIFDLSNDLFPPTDRSDFYHEEFTDELAHIISLLEYDCFYFKSKPDPGKLTSIVNFGIRENVLSTTNVNVPFEDDQSPLLAYIVWIFLPFLIKDNVFNPGILVSNEEKSPHLLSHRGFKAFQLISESPMMISGGDIPILDVLIAWILKTRARSFILRSLDLHILSFILGIQYPNLID